MSETQTITSGDVGELLTEAIYEDVRTIADEYGREVTVTHDARGYGYVLPGFETILPASDDQRVIGMLSMFDRPQVEEPFDRAAAAEEINDAVAAIYGRFMRFGVEYEQREREAEAFKAGAYLGTVPPRVAEFATPADMPVQQATDLILLQAAQLRVAQSQLGGLRMRKYEILRAIGDADARDLRASILGDIHAIGARLT